jgi:hypothetical protein
MMDNAMPGCFLKIDVAAADSKKKGAWQRYAPF